MSECVCVCVCVCVFVSVCARARFLSLKLTSMPIVREVFSKITDSNLTTKSIFFSFLFVYFTFQ